MTIGGSAITNTILSGLSPHTGTIISYGPTVPTTSIMPGAMRNGGMSGTQDGYTLTIRNGRRHIRIGCDLTTAVIRNGSEAATGTTILTTGTLHITPMIDRITGTNIIMSITNIVMRTGMSDITLSGIMKAGKTPTITNLQAMKHSSTLTNQALINMHPMRAMAVPQATPQARAVAATNTTDH